MTDGRRECISRTIPSALEHLRAPWGAMVIHDDSGSSTYRWWLNQQFGPLGFEVVWNPKGRQGFGGAIRKAWSYIREELPADAGRYVFHLEDDFTFNRNVDLVEMARVLAHNPHLVQMALRRQPWNDTERAAGGIVECDPWAYEERIDWSDTQWLEHRKFFTTNPSLYPRTLCDIDWPTGARSEGKFGCELFGSDSTARSGFWGERYSGEWVEHIGSERVGMNY